MLYNSQRTIYGTALSLAMITGKPYRANPETTLNIKFNIKPEILHLPSIYPIINYLSIGIGGNEQFVIDSGYSFSRHTAVDRELFTHIPFIMRIATIEHDLSEEEKLIYKFRIVKNYNGINYACYYLRKINDVIYTDDIYKIQTSEDSSVGAGYLSKYNTINPRVISPVPVDRTNMNLSTTSATYVCKIVKLPFILTPSDIVELQKVLSIIYPNENQHITEIGVCSGVDMPGDEPAIVQICYFAAVDIDLAVELATNNGVFRNLELGGLEPLIL